MPRGCVPRGVELARGLSILLARCRALVKVFPLFGLSCLVCVCACAWGGYFSHLHEDSAHILVLFL